MVDKLIQNTKGNMTLEQSYKTELLKIMENTTCLITGTKILKPDYPQFNPKSDNNRIRRDT